MVKSVFLWRFWLRVIFIKILTVVGFSFIFNWPFQCICFRGFLLCGSGLRFSFFSLRECSGVLALSWSTQCSNRCQRPQILLGL